MEKLIANTLDRQKEILLGSIIKYHRKNQNLSTNYFSSIVGISSAYMSEIENGRKRPATYTLNKIFIELDLDFDFNTAIIVEFEEKFNLFYNAIVNSNDKKVENIYNNICCDKNKFSCSFVALDYLILEYIYYIYTNPNIHREKIECLDKTIISFKDQITKKLLACFYDYRSVYFFNLNQCNKAIQSLTIALNEKSTETILSSIYYHLAIIYQYLQQFGLALDNLIKAEHYCEKTYNYRKRMFLHIIKANIFSRLNEYVSADKLYNNVAQLAIDLNEREILIYAYENAAWNSLKGNLDNCSKYIEEARKHGSKYSYLWLYELIIFYKQGDVNKCASIIDSFKQEKISDDFLSQIMHVFKQKISNKKTTSILVELYRKSNKEKDYEKKTFITYLLIEELLTQSDYESAFKYLSTFFNFKV